jgi:YHS domain-containing protein
VPCPDVFVQDVPSAVNRKGLIFQDYFDPARPAVLDAAHCVRLNYEAWFFADDAGRQRFLANPLASCGLLTDPVSKQRFRPAADAPSAECEGVTFYFENGANRDFFVGDPERYRLPHWKM